MEKELDYHGSLVARCAIASSFKEVRTANVFCFYLLFTVRCAFTVCEAME